MTYMLGFGVFTAVAAVLGSSAAVAATIGAIGAGVTAAATAAGVGYTIASAQDARRKQANALSKQESALSKQESAQAQAVKAAEGQRKRSEMVVNQANRQQPNVAGITQAARAGGGDSGASGTMLTGPIGVDPNTLELGKSTLLGS